MKTKESSPLHAIQTAMEAEMDAHNFYSKAAHKTKNLKGRDMFSQLADFERNHFLQIKALFHSLKGEEKWIAYPGTKFPGKGKKIRTELTVSNGVESLADDIDAISMAIKEERKAQKYYHEMAPKTTDPLGRDMFKKLAREEELHERVLNDQFYSLANKGIWTWGD